MKSVALALLSIPSFLSAGCCTGIFCCGYSDESPRYRVPTNPTAQTEEHAPLPVEHQGTFSLREENTPQNFSTDTLHAPPTPRPKPLDVEALDPATEPSQTQGAAAHPFPTQGAALPSISDEESEEDDSNNSDGVHSSYDMSELSEDRRKQHEQMDRSLFSQLYKRVMENEAKVLKLLRKRNDPTDYVKHLDCSKDTILHHACDLGHAQIVKEIVNAIGNTYDLIELYNRKKISPYNIALAHAKQNKGVEYEIICRCLEDYEITRSLVKNRNATDDRPNRRSGSSDDLEGEGEILKERGLATSADESYLTLNGQEDQE